MSTENKVTERIDIPMHSDIVGGAIDGEAWEQRLIQLHGMGNAKPASVASWLHRDTWTRDEGLALLLGILPASGSWGNIFRLVDDSTPPLTERIIHARYLDGSVVDLCGWRKMNALPESEQDWPVYPDAWPVTSILLLELGVRLRGLEELWDSGGFAPRNSPDFFIQWAARKKIDIPWLKWARDERLLPSDEVAELSGETKKVPMGKIYPDWTPLRCAKRANELKSNGDKSFIKSLKKEIGPEISHPEVNRRIRTGRKELDAKNPLSAAKVGAASQKKK